MAVPDNTKFNLQDVVNEVIPLTNDLASCFASAVPRNFDSNYEGNKDRLLNFRNYGGSIVSFTQFQMTTQKYTSTGLVNCLNTSYTTYWHNGLGYEPVIGDIVYQDSAGLTTHDGRWFGSNAWRVVALGNNVIQINASGVIVADSPMCQF